MVPRRLAEPRARMRDGHHAHNDKDLVGQSDEVLCMRLARSRNLRRKSLSQSAYAALSRCQMRAQMRMQASFTRPQ